MNTSEFPSHMTPRVKKLYESLIDKALGDRSERVVHPRNVSRCSQEQRPQREVSFMEIGRELFGHCAPCHCHRQNADSHDRCSKQRENP